MRKGLLRQVKQADAAAEQFQLNVAAAIDTLAADHDVMSAPTATYVATGAVKAGQTVVVFGGAAGQTLTLPQAKGQGNNVGTVVLMLNTSVSAVILAATVGDTVNGAKSISVGAGAAKTLVSDGISKWLVA